MCLRNIRHFLYFQISGLVQAGASCGTFIMSPIAQWLISTYGAQMACRILAVVFLIGVGAVAWMIVPCPEGWLPPLLCWCSPPES